MTNYVSGWRLLVVLVLFALAVALGITSPNWDGRNVLALVLVVVAVVVAATAPRGTLADDEDDAKGPAPIVHFAPPAATSRGVRGQSWFVTGRDGMVIATFRHDGRTWEKVTAPRWVR